MAFLAMIIVRTFRKRNFLDFRQGQERFVFPKTCIPVWGPPSLTFNGYWRGSYRG